MRCMRKVMALVAGLALAATAGDLTIQSFDNTGKLSFGELSDATAYRVEWAPGPGGPWTNFLSAHTSLDSLPATGMGSITCSVPMCYRVVATLMPATPTSFSIAGGAATTTVRTVTLNHAYTGRPVYYLASENADFAGASWQAWTGTPTFTLSAGDGIKTLYLKLKNAAGEASSVITDTIDYIEPMPPLILQQPQSATNYAGSNVTFTVIATGTAPFYFQWRKHGTNLVDGGNVSGSALSLLAITNLAVADAGNFAVVVSNLYGAVTSQVAVLTVTNAAPPQQQGLYLVVDLSGGTNATSYPVTYLDAVPPGGWTDEHKTTKLVLRRIPATVGYTGAAPRANLGAIPMRRSTRSR